jgi:hypothetical protein
MPSIEDKRSQLPEQVVNEFGRRAETTGRILSKVGENFMAMARGGTDAVVHFPNGFEILPSGERIVKLPIYVIIPTTTGEAPGGGAGKSWKVPRASGRGEENETKDITIIGGEGRDFSEEEGVRRPVALLKAAPVIPGNNNICTLELSRGLWKPGLLGNMPILKGEATEAVSLSDGGVIGEFTKGLDDQGVKCDLTVRNLTASRLVNAMMLYFNETDDVGYGPSLVEENGLLEGLKIIRELNPSWAAFWENVQAREVLGAILNNPLHSGPLIFGNIFNLSVMTYPQHQEALSERKNAFVRGLEGGGITNWESLVNNARETFADLEIPVVINPGINPVQALLASSHATSLTSPEPVVQLLEGQEGEGSGELLELPFIKNPYELLLAFPSPFAILGEAMMTTFADKLALISEEKVKFVNAGLTAELAVTQAYTEGMEELTKTITREINRIGGIKYKAKRSGREAARQISDDLPGDIQSTMSRLYRTKWAAQGNIRPGALGVENHGRSIGEHPIKRLGIGNIRLGPGKRTPGNGLRVDKKGGSK